MFADLRNNLKSSGSSLYECSINYSTLKRSFASRIPTTTSGRSSGCRYLQKKNPPPTHRLGQVSLPYNLNSLLCERSAFRGLDLIRSNGRSFALADVPIFRHDSAKNGQQGGRNWRNGPSHLDQDRQGPRPPT
jgi:hypothetical protein